MNPNGVHPSHVHCHPNKFHYRVEAKTSMIPPFRKNVVKLCGSEGEGRGCRDDAEKDAENDGLDECACQNCGNVLQTAAEIRGPLFVAPQFHGKRVDGRG